MAETAPAAAPAAEAGPVKIRTLFINLALSGFIAVVVFVAASLLYLVPVMSQHDLRVQQLEAQVHALNARMQELQDSAAEPAPADAPAPAAAAPADAPAAAPAAVPAAAPAAAPADAPKK